jgi:protein involved in polysaccharide export with SLBB domain
MYLKGLAALALGGVAAGIGYIGFGNASGHPVRLDAPWVEHGLDWAENGLVALRARIGAEDGAAGQAAGAALEAAVRDGLAAQAPAAPPPSAEPPKGCADPDRLTPGAALIGDKLSLRFFEKETEAAALAASAAPVYFERLDLSGSYDVDARGEISIPLVGRVAADGRTLACVEALVASRYAETFLTDASVSAAFAARPAVIVTGAVRAPGSYAVTPGMVLRQLLALAGAKSMQPDPGEAAAVAPLLARKAELEALSAGLRLETRVLTAARAHQADPGLTADERSLFQSRLGATRVQSELDNLSARVDAFARAKADRTAQVAEKRAMLALMHDEEADLDRQVAEKRQRLDELRALTTRGLAPLTRLSADEAALITLEHSDYEVASAVLAQQAAVRAAEEALAAVDGDYRSAVAGELRDRTRDADAIDAQLAAIDLQIDLLRDGPGAGPERVTIVRTEAGGTTRLEGTLASVVLPGDLVEVGSGESRVSELR